MIRQILLTVSHTTSLVEMTLRLTSLFIGILLIPDSLFTAKAWIYSSTTSYDRRPPLRPYGPLIRVGYGQLQIRAAAGPGRTSALVEDRPVTTTTPADATVNGDPEGTDSQVAGATAPASSIRGKVNEIDFCIAPADVSLSRAYAGLTALTTTTTTTANTLTTPPSVPILSLTRALNNASNRAVRRILLARSWPSAEALNLSLRQVAAAEKQRALKKQQQQEQQLSNAAAALDEAPKCPVPRPILNVLMMRQTSMAAAVPAEEKKTAAPAPRSRSDAEYVADQLQNFRERYDSLPGYPYAEAYLEAILSLATSGVESPRVQQVVESKVYGDAYRRVVAVLRSVGVVFEVDVLTNRTRIAPKLIDQDICLSMLDKLQLREQRKQANLSDQRLPSRSETDQRVYQIETESSASTTAPNTTETIQPSRVRRIVRFLIRRRRQQPEDQDLNIKKEATKVDVVLTSEDLGGVLLSSEEPTMTRQLNALANIVQRALLFGGDQELLVLAETLDADRAAFVERWYPGTGGLSEAQSEESDSRPGVQFMNCLVRVLRDCYENGIVTSLDPPLPLTNSYANAYERLMMSSVELGSGYIKPTPVITITNVPKPRTAQEELGRFAVWETAFRQTKPDVSSYPEDLEGTWEVRDEISGETIGTSSVVLEEAGNVKVAPPLEGLRWRLDPGPAHLDTCTFQVLNNDGTILQYRGFIDRGARLEARFSRRPIQIRGSVMFQMRDGSTDYYKDILPINYKTGTTKFVMTKLSNN